MHGLTWPINCTGLGVAIAISIVPAIICGVNLYVGVLDPSNGVEKALTLLVIVVGVCACQVVAKLVSCWCGGARDGDKSKRGNGKMSNMSLQMSEPRR